MHNVGTFIRQSKALLLNWGLTVGVSSLLMICIALVIDAPIRTGLIAAIMAVSMSRLMRYVLGLIAYSPGAGASWKLLIRRSQNSAATYYQRLGQIVSGIILGLLLLLIVSQVRDTDKNEMSVSLGLIVGLAMNAIIQEVLPLIRQNHGFRE